MRRHQDENQELQERLNPRTDNPLSDMTDILLRFLQDLFFRHPPGKYHFEPGEGGETDERRTEIILTGQASVTTHSVAKRPAIILSRGAFAFGNTHLDNLVSNRSVTAERLHTDLLSGSFTFSCVSRSGLEAERLAMLCATYLRVYRRQLQRAGFHQIGDNIQIGQEGPPGSILSGDSVEDFVAVPVSLPAFYQFSWFYQPNAEVLRTLRVQLNTMAAGPDKIPAIPNTLDEVGNPIPGAAGVIIQAWSEE